MATLLKVLNNLADIKSAGGVALRVRTQGRRMEHEFRQNKVGIRIANLSQNILGSAAQFAHKSERSWVKCVSPKGFCPA